MKRTIEIEYVGADDVRELLDLVMEVQGKGHYVSMSVANYGNDVSIGAMMGGFRSNEPYDFHVSFSVGDSASDVEGMHMAKNWLREVLAERDGE